MTEEPGKNGHKKLGPDDLARLIAPSAVTPDQGCSVIIFSAIALIVSIAFWMIVYFRNADEFKPAGSQQGPPASQIRQEREAAQKERLNR
ncbi:MAG: hypothetical protein H7145_06320 [Akkermansiaceae bacterium]|nr:hypothetical protein [Armatimonadota bacterium]